MLQLLGIAVGRIGISYDEFLRLDVDAFEAIVKSYCDHEEDKRRDDWERMRWQTMLTIQPFVGNKHKMKLEDILVFSWDKQDKKNVKTMTPAEQRARMKKLVERLGDKTV